LGFEDLLGFSFLAGLLYGIGEEAGWRGFALLWLQSGRSALAATLILTVFWALWHTPFFFYRFEFGAVQVIAFFMGLLAGAIWLTCLYNATGGSILMVAAWHTTWNLVNQVAMVVSVEILSAMSVMVMILAIAVVVVFGPATLSPRPSRRCRPSPLPALDEGTLTFHLGNSFCWSRVDLLDSLRGCAAVTVLALMLLLGLLVPHLALIMGRLKVEAPSPPRDH